MLCIFFLVTALISLSGLHGQPAVAKKDLTASPSPEKSVTEPLEEKLVRTNGTVEIGGKSIAYTADTGTLTLRDKSGKDKAGIFFISYMRDGVDALGGRPITFCTNGGPGSSSVWLHLGLLGPRRVEFTAQGYVDRPYHLVNNNHSLLDVTDLVFIDPVSTGYSRAAKDEDEGQFHGVQEDVEWLGEFIRRYLIQFKRWESPKFFAGESYGTTRAAALAEELHTNQHIYLDGLVLISSVLNFQTISFDSGSDLPYILFLPTYASVAWYHNQLDPALQKRPLRELLAEVEAWAAGPYATALLQGDHLQFGVKRQIAETLSRYTGLSVAYVLQANMRVNIGRFTRELLRDRRRTVGRFDGRLTGIEVDAAGESFSFDPSTDALFGAFTAAFNHYVSADLRWDTNRRYEIMADVRPWKFGDGTNCYLNVSESLRTVMSRNTQLRVFVASGKYDLATPYFATVYTFRHLGLEPELRDHVTLKEYPGGHMMYSLPPILQAMKKDLAAFYKETLAPRPPIDFYRNGNSKKEPIVGSWVPG